jgi:hypothetical protein
MHIDVIEDLRALAGLEDNWNAVYDADPDAHLFLSWKWLSAWLTLPYGPWVILAAKTSNVPESPYIGFFPLRILAKTSNNGHIRNEINMVGNFGADYTGLLCRPEYDNKAISAFVRQIKRMNWARLSLAYVRMSEPRTRKLLSHFTKGRFVTKDVSRVDKIDGTNNCVCPVSPLPNDWESYLSGLSANTRQKIRRLIKLIDAGTEFRITEATSATIDQDLDRLLNFWEIKWKDRKGDRIHELVRANRRMLNLSYQSGLLLLPTLWCEDRPLVASAVFVDRRKRALLFYMTGRDETFDGPPAGLMLHAHSIRQAIHNGFVEYDFMRGNEPYKYSFGVQERFIHYFTIETRNGVNLGLRLDSRTVNDVLEQATTFHRAGKIEEAERAYKQVLDAEPKHLDAMHRLGQLLAAKGDHLAAMRVFKSLTGLRPDLFKPWLCLAQCLEALNREFDAANAYREVVRIRPDSSDAFSGLARVLVRLGKLEEVNSALMNVLAGSVSFPAAKSNGNRGRMRLQ